MTIIQAQPLKQFGISGPASALDNEIAVFDGVTGKKIKAGSGVLIAELVTLTDNSIADTLHRHSELVASDGSPDPALSVDASGNVGIGTDSPDSKLHISQTQGDVRVKDLSSIDANSDIGITFDGAGSLDSAMLTEVDGTIFSYGINVDQVGTRDTARPGGMFRLDTRLNGAFVILGQPISSVAREILNFALGAPSGALRMDSSGKLGIGITPVTQLDVNAPSGIHGIRAQTAGSSQWGGVFVNTHGDDTEVDLAGGTYSAIFTGGNVGIGTTDPTAELDIDADLFRLRTAKTPATAGAAGNQGDECWDANYCYRCVATNTWKRTALTTW